MKPAPIDEAGCAHCGCGACRATIRFQRWHKLVRRGVMFVVKHCPDCGRALGFDAEGNPIVGGDPAELERILLEVLESNTHFLDKRIQEENEREFHRRMFLRLRYEGDHMERALEWMNEQMAGTPFIGPNQTGAESWAELALHLTASEYDEMRHVNPMPIETQGWSPDRAPTRIFDPRGKPREGSDDEKVS